MWIILNPKKTNRFTAKGINMYKSSPTAFVGPDTDNETMTVINRALISGDIIRVADNEMSNISIPSQAEIGSIDTEDTDTKAHSRYIKNKDGKILSTVIVMPDEDGNAEEKPLKNAGVILTGIYEEERDEDEVSGED